MNPYRIIYRSMIRQAYFLVKDTTMPSTVISSFHYKADKQILQVIFVSGAIYEYLEVPADIYLTMKNYLSKGEFLNKIIKGQYEFRKIK